MAEVFIGTSGWQYLHWRGNFYPENLPTKDWLKYYSQFFKTVEVNSSFYRQTQASTFEKWQEQTPKDFIFAIKGNRFITHIKRLKDCKEPLKVFFEAVESLEEGKHVVLWQLPPSLKLDIPHLEIFLKLLPTNPRQAFEFRHESWFDEQTWAVLQQYSAAVVFQDFPGWPMTRQETTDFVYLRFHGNRQLYSSKYTNEELKAWATDIKIWLGQGKDIYAYFNNDAQGFAVSNALQLRELIQR